MPFIFLRHWFYSFLLDCSPHSAHTVFSLSFFSITPATLVAARHCAMHTAIGWSARLPDRHKQGERIWSPMPGNLPDNGMWTPNNIHKYSDEAKWGCPGEVCGAIAVRGVCKEETRTGALCWYAVLGEAGISFCHVAGVRDAAALIFLPLIWAPLFKQVKTAGSSD